MSTASDDTTWRDKYLTALDEQEQLEQRSSQQYGLLRRALVQVSLVADGLDRHLDPLLDQLRELLRKDTAQPPMEQLAPLLDELDQAVRSLESRRQAFDEELLGTLTRLTGQLRSLNPTGSTKADIRQFVDRLPARSQKINLFPALLDQLADLQQQALAQLQQPRTGLVARLTGQGSAPAVPGETVAPALKAELSEQLLSLLNALDPEAATPERLDALKAQIHPDLALDDLPPLLAQVRDLIVKAWLAAQGVFAQYLDNVNSELADITGVLGGAVASEARRTSIHQSVQNTLEQQCQTLAEGASNARDLQQLKQQVANQLSQIRNAVAQFRSAEEEENATLAQLQQLSERLKLMEQQAEANRTSLLEQRHKALHDPLTQLPNREAYDERLQLELQRWQRYQHPLTLAVLDIDHFKQINDRFGHQAGDRVLKVIGRAIGQRLREVDFFGRYGGEEFVMILPETDAQAALKALDAIRQAIVNTAFNYRQEPLSISFCVGIAQFQPDDKPEQVFSRADQALYEAKANGRNQCRIG